MKTGKIELLFKDQQKLALEVGFKVGEERIKAKEENGSVVVELPIETVVTLLSSPTADDRYRLIEPERIEVTRNKGFGRVNVVLTSVSQSKVVEKDTDAPEDEALDLIATLTHKYEKLDWEKEQFVNFCEENNIEVKGNWGIPKMIKELVSYDSELSVTLEEYLAR